MAVGMGRILGAFRAFSATLQRFTPNGVIIDSIGTTNGITNPTFGAAVTIDTSQATGSLWQRITANAATAPTIGAPSQMVSGQRLTITIRNASGGAMGATTFNAIYKLGAAWVNPANGESRTIEFLADGTNWIEIGRTAADVDN